MNEHVTSLQGTPAASSDFQRDDCEKEVVIEEGTNGGEGGAESPCDKRMRFV